MNAKNAVIDAFDLMMDQEEPAVNAEEEARAVDEAFIEVLNQSVTFSIAAVAERAGVTVEKAIADLQGAIFQCPEAFDDSDTYDITKGWMLSASYLSGNAGEKLKNARRMNKRFPGRFEKNIEALKKILPAEVAIDGIHINLGASWIPAEEYGAFVRDFLHLSKRPLIAFPDDLSKFKIISPPEAEGSVLNTITYGVREDVAGSAERVKQYLTAIDIITQTIIGKDIKVFDYHPKRSYGWTCFEYEPVFNKNKTIEAQDKQRQIMDAFKEWVYSSPARIAKFEQYYNDAFVGYTFPQYDGSFLLLPDLNPDIVLYKHQRDAIARVLLSGNHTLFAHDVGTGKTYEMFCSCHELKRMHLSEKNLIVVPNNVLKASVDTYRLLYKDDKILPVYPKDFTPDKRNEILMQIRDGDYAAVFMAYSSFDMIVMSKQHYIDKMTAQISDLKAASFNSKRTYEKKSMIKQANALSKKLTKYMAEAKECPWLTFDELGINTLVVDEAHNYKNIPTRSRSENVVGMSVGGSKKCREMLEKAHSVDRLIFATGTPLTNSLADLFTFQTYLQPGVLAYHNIHTFDAWVNTFGQRETTVECGVDANSASLRTVTRFTSFHNLSELMSLFSQVCDFYHMEQDEEGLPQYNGPVDICVPRSEAQGYYVDELSERTDRIHNKEINRTEDNLLKVTIDGRKAALDIRLTDCKKPLEPGAVTKIDGCAENVLRLYREYPGTAQVVFSDIGTPKDSFNVYDCLTERLVEQGIPRSEIAYIHDAATESARSKLFAAMNQGTLRVVIGSTQKLGVGVNVQERLVALHHLSVPWRPADMVQREGRILRKGNTCAEVFIFRYITKGTFDAYSWQLLETKQKFIASFLSGTSAAREMEDIAGSVLAYAEVKALAIGNPLIKTRVEVANTLERAKIASRARQRQMQELRVVIDTAPEKIRRLKRLAKTAERDHAAYTEGKEAVPNHERIAFGEELLAALAENIAKAEERFFDEYQGFSVFLPAGMLEDRAYVLIRSINGGEYYCEMEPDKTPMGCSRTVDYLLEHLTDRAGRLREQIAALRKQVLEARADLEQDNPHLAEVVRIQKELADIDIKLEACLQERRTGVRV